MHLKFITVQDQEAILTKTQEQWGMAVAFATAQAIPLPVQALEDPLSAFNNAGPTVKALLGIFNEVRPFNIADVSALTAAVWLSRYAQVHSSLVEKADRVMAHCDARAAIFGFTFYLSQNQLKDLSENAEGVACLLPIALRSAAAIVASNELEIE